MIRLSGIGRRQRAARLGSGVRTTSSWSHPVRTTTSRSHPLRTTTSWGHPVRTTTSRSHPTIFGHPVRTTTSRSHPVRTTTSRGHPVRPSTSRGHPVGICTSRVNCRRSEGAVRDPRLLPHSKPEGDAFSIREATCVWMAW
jgi:hypothetical protein